MRGLSPEEIVRMKKWRRTLKFLGYAECSRKKGVKPRYVEVKSEKSIVLETMQEDDENFRQSITNWNTKYKSLLQFAALNELPMPTVEGP